MKTIVIGGGAIGLACAFHLQKAGSEVTVIEASECGLGASRGNAGWIVPFLSSPRPGPGAVTAAFKEIRKRDGAVRIRTKLNRSYLSWLIDFLQNSTEKKHRLGTQAMLNFSLNAVESFEKMKEVVPFEFYKEGLLVAALSESSLHNMVESHKEMQGYGYNGDGKWIDSKQLRQMEPALSDKVQAGFHLVDEGHVRPESFLKGTSQYLKDLGVEILENHPVEKLFFAGANHWNVILKNGETLKADNIVMAAGAHSKQLLSSIGVSLPMERAKGVSITAQGIGILPKHPLKLLEVNVACTPFSDSVRLSGTYDIGYDDVEINPNRLDAVIRNGKQYLRDWNPQKVDFTWAGHRPVTPDDLPVLGPVPKYEGLFLATGHGTVGLTLAPLTGEMIAAAVCKEMIVPEMEPFTIQRFTKIAQ